MYIKHSAARISRSAVPATFTIAVQSWALKRIEEFKAANLGILFDRVLVNSNMG
jgi:hypothetical protein